MTNLLILEMQDGMMCKNDKTIVKEMIDKASENKPDHIDMIFKWQLYTKIKTYVEIIPLNHDIFEYAYEYGKKNGFQTTASIFDKDNLEYLKQFDIPFIKIACQTDLYDFRKNMWDLLSADIKNIVSVQNKHDHNKLNYIGIEDPPYDIKLLSCVPKYPATIKEYEELFYIDQLQDGISDHTVGLGLYNKYKPKIFEKHYYIEGLDSWDKDWAIKPEQLRLL